MTDELSKRLVPDELRNLAEPLLPEFAPRPQGGGTAPADERADHPVRVPVPSEPKPLNELSV